MKKLFLAFALVACFAVSALGQSSPPLRVKEADGSPNVSGVTTIVVSNGSITSVQGKTIYLTTGGGGGGGSPGGSSTQVQYNAAGSFGGISGFTSDGTNVTAGSGNLRATRPRFITSIDDTNGNEVFIITATGSAVNEVTIANAATGNNPTFTASGGDANVGINFVPKGSGTIQVSGAAIVTVSATQTLTNKTLTTPIIAQISNTGTLTLPTSTDTLVGRATTDTLTNKTLSTSNTVSAALTWTAGVKQTFAPDATTAGINVGSVAGNPSVPSNADLWYNTATNELYARINGANVALGSGGGGGITIGTTTITSGANTRVLYNNAGVVGEYVITGTGNVMMSASPTTTGRLTAADANFTTAVTTGSGTTAGFQITADSLTTGNGTEISSSSVSSGNVVSIAATGTAAASNSKHALLVATSGANATSTQTTYGAEITNTSTGTSSTNIALRVSASGGTNNTAINVGAGQVLLDNGTASAPAIAWRAVTNVGFFIVSGSQFRWSTGGTQRGEFNSDSIYLITNTGQYRVGSSNDVILRRNAAANWAFGDTDAASPVAQTLSVQNVVGGTSNTAGVNWTFAASRGTGTGAGGSHVWQVAPAGSTGSSQNALVTALTLASNTTATFDSIVTTGTGSTSGTVFNYNSLTTGNGANFSSSSVSSGNVVSIAATGTAAASNSKHALLVATSGANATSSQTTYGAEITNTSTGTSSTNIALGLSASGGTTNYALSVAAGQIVAPNGSASAPAYSFTGSPTVGMSTNGSWVRLSGFLGINTTFAGLPSNGTFGWMTATGDPVAGSSDIQLARGASANLKIHGSSGTTAATLSTPALTPAQITADQNNYAPGTGWFQRWSSDASRNVTGLSAGQDGQLAEIWNVGSNNIVLQNENASSTAANRFTTSTGADLTLTAGKCAIARYDTTSTRWRVYLCN